MKTADCKKGLGKRNHSFRDPRCRTRGTQNTAAAFSLIEVMISIVVLSVVFVGFYLNLSQGFASAEVSRENLRATQILEQQMETIRLYTWDQINSNGYVPTNFTVALDPTGTTSNGLIFTATTVITNAPVTEAYSNNLVLVTTTLTWTSDNGNRHTRKMSTLVSEYGLHNYYY
jgi:prepilin-type N-terminal cleavage/methylation domain-containing protein